jgi:hypothetical protein
MTNPTKALAALLALVVALLPVAACGGGNGETTTGAATTATTGDEKPAKSNGRAAAPPTIVVRDGEPVGGVRELEFEAGERIRFRVRSDLADELHVHGYDVNEEIPAGRSAAISFPAEIEGIFEVELHGSGAQIAELRVNP